MDYSATLTAAEATALSDPDQTCYDAMQHLEQLWSSDERAFQKGIRLKNTLDVYEGRAKTDPSWRVCALLVNCEYRLWCIHAETVPIRRNPFLTHWVEALQRLETGRVHEEGGLRNGSSAKNSITSADIATIRVEWIKRLLSNKSTDVVAKVTTRDLYDAAIRLGVRRPFDIQPYIDMLVEEGIWEKQPSVINPCDGKQKVAIEGPNTPKDWKKALLHQLKEQPNAAVQQLTHLPIELSSLDFLTTLLADRTLETHSIEPAPVITSYIQHTLRLAERMGAPPPGQDVDGAITGAAGDAVEAYSPWEYGKEAQSRAVRLLLLFMKSLITKGFLGTEVLYFEIQEVCVRYVWIKEVRDFRSWVERSVGGEEAI